MGLKQHTQLFLFVSIFFLFLGCARYKVEPLEQLISNSITNKSSISFEYSVFNKDDCKRFLDRDVLAKGYQPIYIAISNNTKHYLKFYKNKISLPSVPTMQVAKKMHTSTLARAAGYGIAGFFVWVLIIPAIVDGIGSSQANMKLDNDFLKKELHDQIITPFTTINGLIFVPIDKFKQNFKITLFDAENNNQFILTTDNKEIYEKTT